jgi:hypothetical protein
VVPKADKADPVARAARVDPAVQVALTRQQPRRILPNRIEGSGHRLMGPPGDRMICDL